MATQKTQDGVLDDRERGGGGYSLLIWVEVCSLRPKTFTLFMTKIGDIPYTIYDQTKNSEPNL